MFFIRMCLFLLKKEVFKFEFMAVDVMDWAYNALLKLFK